MKVFDNLYYVGEREYSSWAVTTSAGIIIIDPIYDYSVEEQVVGGLKKLGLDPAQIKYVVVSHAHRDHAGGAWYLQERFGARVLLTAPDWDMLERNKQNWPKPKRDMVVADRQQLTLGDTTLTFIHTFGHTPGTMSTLVPVKDNGKPHVAALWGGTGFNFTITPQQPASHWFDAYIASAQRFREAAAKAGADVFLSNHPSWDGSDEKMAKLAKRAAGEPHPYVIGAKNVQNYFTIAEHCAQAGSFAPNKGDLSVYGRANQSCITKNEKRGSDPYLISRITPSHLLRMKILPSGPSPYRRSARVGGFLPCSASWPSRDRTGSSSALCR